MHRYLLLAALFMFGPVRAVPQHQSGSPNQRPDSLGPCRTVHGRLGRVNGAVLYKLWVVGTKRIMGIDTVPGWLGSTMTRQHVKVFADFVICPLTPLRPGEMQLVTVDTAMHVVLVHDNFFGPS